MSFAARAGAYMVLAAAVLAAACSRPGDAVHQREFYAFGTLISMSVYGVERDLAERAVAAAKEDFAYMHDTWHPWEPGPLGRVNQLLPLEANFSLPPSLMPVLQQATALSHQSGGLFNPAIGNLVALWGFSEDALATRAPPEEKAIADLVAKAPSMDDLVMEGMTLRSVNPAVRLDFGAFAKGYGIDRVVERLKELGVANAIVNAGGDLRAIGAKGEQPWRVGIRHPRGGGVLASLAMRGDESVVTSGDYERFFEHEGKRYHHILDPRTGYPARGLTSVTVVHESAAAADAAATALFVAGPDGWAAVAKAMGVTQAMVVDEAGVVRITEALAERIHFETEPPAVQVEKGL